MSIILWYADRWSDEPEERAYAKETPHFGVHADGRRDAKASSYSRLFHAKEEAQQWIEQNKAEKEAARKLRLVREAAPELLEALERMVKLNMPLTGTPSHAELVDFWEYEKTQGRGEADDQLFVLAAIAKARGEA